MSAPPVQRPGEVAVEAYSIPAAVFAYSLSRAFLYKAMQAGNLKATKIGRRTVLRKTDIDAWLDAQPAYQPTTSAVA
jgi:excisionase family DNA binding protein